MKVFAIVLCLVAATSARMAYRFSDGYLDILGAEPVQNFDCLGRPYGYYADVASNCQVFHVCLPITDEVGEVAETAHFSFFCGNGTVFSQESLTCDHPDNAFPCEEAETLFTLSNADFGRIPEEGAIPVVPEAIPINPVTVQSRSQIDEVTAVEDTSNVDAARSETVEDDANTAIPVSVPEATLSTDVEVADTVNVEVEEVPEVTSNIDPAEVTEDIVS